MSVNFKALGGLFTFRYINDVEDMELDDLQEMYDDMEEEFHVIEVSMRNELRRVNR